MTKRNFGSALTGPKSGIYHSLYPTVAAVFPNVYALALDHRAAGPERTTDVLLVGSRQAERLTAKEWFARAATYQSKSYIQTEEMKAMVGDLLLEPPQGPTRPIFTDDYAPIEVMAF